METVKSVALISIFKYLINFMKGFLRVTTKHVYMGTSIIKVSLLLCLSVENGNKYKTHT